MNQEYNDTSSNPSGEIRAMVPSDIRGHDIMLQTIPHYTFFSVIDRHFSNNASLYLCTQSEEFSAMCVENNITYSDNFLINDGENGVGEFLPMFGKQIVLWLAILLVLEFIEHFVDSKIINRYVWYLSIYAFLKLFDDTFSGFVLFVLLIVDACRFVSEYLKIKSAESVVKRGSNKVDAFIGGNGIEAEPDDDVINEQKRILSGNVTSDEVLITEKLSKIYRTNRGPLKAVKDMSFGVKPKTCFGLLGINGAGKSTAFKMFTGDESITEGDCRVCNFSLKSNKSKAQQAVGYCPQFDALIDCLTGIETLNFYCDLRGLHNTDKENSVNELLRVLDLLPHMRKECGIYSGGNKRKLSTALAMVGEPKLLFLDEPSTGMDPGARHALWDSILKMQSRGASIILTSHSMEECEALCSRLAIMVNGQFQCIGTVQHLRNKYGRGFTIELALDEARNNSQDVQNSMQNSFAQFNIEVKEDHGDFVVYDIPISPDDNDPKNVSLSYVFGELNRLKTTCGLVGFSVRQRTLEEMFLNFTKSQREDERVTS